VFTACFTNGLLAEPVELTARIGFIIATGRVLPLVATAVAIMTRRR
jgi:hypothetical protein